MTAAVCGVKTALGPMAVVVDLDTDRLLATLAGHRTLQEAVSAAQNKWGTKETVKKTAVSEGLQRYADGEPIDFAEVELADASLTPFRRQVTRACRSIRWGHTSTYQQLAKLAGAPRGARAVGRVMATNLWPIIVPCHRVIRAGGAIGGFSAPQGVCFKERLLQHEGVLVA